MHTVVVISIDMNLLNFLENLFPECRIEMVDIEEMKFSV